MPRLRRLAVFVLLLAARPSAAAPTEQDLIKAAKDRVAACAKAPPPGDVCAKAGQVLEAYLAVLAKANECAAAPCPAGVLDEIFRAERKLDELEASLPDGARADATGRPFLRISLLIAQRAAVALAAVDPKAEPPPRYDPPVDAPRMVEAACLESPAACPDARSALAGAARLKERVAACAASPCGFDRLDEAAVGAEAAMLAYGRIRDIKTSLLTLFSLINDQESRLAMIIAKDAKARLARLDAGLAALDAGLDALKKGAPGAGAVGLEAQVKDLGDLFREATLGRDRVASFLLSDKSAGAERRRLNEAASKLAASRARLLALETARGLGTERADASVVAAAADKGGARKLLAARESAVVAPALLDRRTIPPPAPRNGRAPPILDEAPSRLALLKNLASDDPVKRADARRRMGLSYTVGDPLGRAGLVHRQQHDDTCAVVSQQQVLAAMHLLGPGDQNVQENALRDEASRRGYYGNGIASHYVGDLLVDRGVIVVKKEGAPLKDLDAAVRRGGMVIAGVDARYLWKLEALDQPLGHAIVVTGAEIDRASGRTVGYYINDSGNDPPGRGRFVPAATFEKAWLHRTQSYVEIK